MNLLSQNERNDYQEEDNNTYTEFMDEMKEDDSNIKFSDEFTSEEEEEEEPGNNFMYEEKIDINDI